MIRPMQLSPAPQTMPRIWVIGQLCMVMLLQILATRISPINCDNSQPPPPTPPTAAIASLQETTANGQHHDHHHHHHSAILNPISSGSKNNDKLLHRVARLTKVDYSMLSDETNNNNNNNNNNGNKTNNRSLPGGGRSNGRMYPYNSAGFMASNGLRTLLKPQKFYAKQEWFPSSSETPSDSLISLDLITEPRKDICNGHCQCEKKNAFTTVTCDYQRNPKLSQTFDKSFKLPERCQGLVIKLAPKTRFSLLGGFFNNDTVNRFTIEGTMYEGEQVEIAEDAFLGNNGPFPEIAFTNVFAVIIRQRAFQKKASEGCKFNVTNSNDVILFENAFENTQIRGSFVGIKDFRISEKAFNSAQAKLHIESSYIDNLYRFDASIREIKFVNCTIGTINPGAFDVNNINSIIFESCRIDAIKSRAITEKLYSDLVSITGASIGIIESDAIYGSGIKELKITNNKIDTIHENAIYVTSIFVTISDNNIKHLGNKWLHVKDWRRITVKGNRFGVFGTMQLENSKSQESCIFEGNSLTDPQAGSLNFTIPYCRIREISVNNVCRCDFKWLERLSDHDLKSEIYCTIDDKLGNCFNATVLNFLKYFNEICDETKTILDCKNNQNLKKIEGRFFTPEELAAKNQRFPMQIFIWSSVVVVLFIIIAFVIGMTCRIRRRSTKLSRGSGGGGNSQGRSHLHEFSQNERLVIEQSLQLIQKKYPEIYKKVNERIQIMYIQDLSEEKCVKTTSQIVNLLNKVKNPGNDLMALNGVLTEHLQSPLPTAPPADHTPIYAEPGLTENDEGFYATNTFAHEAAMGLAGAGPEHIYAEPSCAQQPLLPNEYASPADGHMASMDVYTEPINEREMNLTTPYAVTSQLNRPPYQSPYRPVQYTTPMRNQHPLSLAQRQLPDVLSQHNTSSGATNTNTNTNTKPMPSTLSNVRRMAQDLQGKSNFNPIAKPRNLHLVAPPTYTAPDIRHKQLMKTSHIPTAGAGAGAGAAGVPVGGGANVVASDDIELDMRGATALPLNSNAGKLTTDAGSNHSGGSNETVQIDDVIEYADS